MGILLMHARSNAIVDSRKTNLANSQEPTSLDYALPGERPPINFVPLVVCTVMALGCVCLFTLIRIEWLNSAAGGLLPKVESGKWRVSYVSSEKTWREFQARQFNGDPLLLTRPLTPDERARMIHETSKNRANGDLRDFVGTFGLLQYVLVPILFVASLSLFRGAHERRIRVLAMVGICCAILCAAGALQRGYLTSIID